MLFLVHEEEIAQRCARYLSAARRVDPALYRDADQAFGKHALVDITDLSGVYHVVCAWLNPIEIPNPE